MAALASNPDAALARQWVGRMGDPALVDPESLRAWAQLLVIAGEAPEALWVLEDGRRRFPNREELAIELARTALRVGDPLRARATVGEIADSSVHHFEALLIGAHAELELGQLDEALSMLGVAERRYPERPEAGFARILILLREGRAEEAEQRLTGLRATTVDPEVGRELDLLAVRLDLHQGRLDSARQRLETQLVLSPSDPVLIQLLSEVLLRGGHADEALARVRGAALASQGERHVGSGEMVSLEARILVMQEEFAEAVGLLESALAASNSPSHYRELALLHTARADHAQAAKVYARAVEAFPEALRLRVSHVESLVDQGEEAPAKSALADLREIAPEDPHLGYLEARIALLQGDGERALALLEVAVSRLDRGFVQYWLGRALEAAGDRRAAERRYSLALARGGASPDPAIALLRLAEARGDWPVVADAARMWAQRSPRDEAALATWVTALVRSRQLVAAGELAASLVEQRPKSARAVALHAFARRVQGDWEGARSELAAARARMPALEGAAEAELLVEEAHLLVQEGQFSAAADTLGRALALAPEEARFHVAAASLEYTRGRPDVASRHLDAAVVLAPEDPEALMLRARALLRLDRAASALDDLARAKELRPRSAQVSLLRGMALEQMGEVSAAQEAYTEAIAADGNSFAARNNLALLLAADGQLETALEHAQVAYGLAPDNAQVVDTLGWLYVERGLEARGIALLRRALALGGGPEVERHLARAESGQ